MKMDLQSFYVLYLSGTVEQHWPVRKTLTPGEKNILHKKLLYTKKNFTTTIQGVGLSELFGKNFA